MLVRPLELSKVFITYFYMVTHQPHLYLSLNRRDSLWISRCWDRSQACPSLDATRTRIFNSSKLCYSPRPSRRQATTSHQPPRPSSHRYTRRVQLSLTKAVLRFYLTQLMIRTRTVIQTKSEISRRQLLGRENTNDCSAKKLNRKNVSGSMINKTHAPLLMTKKNSWTSTRLKAQCKTKCEGKNVKV